MHSGYGRIIEVKVADGTMGRKFAAEARIALYIIHSAVAIRGGRKRSAC